MTDVLLLSIFVALVLMAYLLWEIRKVLIKTYYETERLSTNYYDAQMEKDK